MSLLFTPSYARWRHGGWYVENVRYPSGPCGCVSNNYPDKQWHIVCAHLDDEITFPTRDAAARAEYVLARTLQAHTGGADWHHSH